MQLHQRHSFRALCHGAMVALIGLTLLALPPGRTAPAAYAADPDPTARIMMKLHSIHVRDDSEWGEAELRYTVTLQRVSPACGGPCANEKFEYTYRFDGDKGITKSFQGAWDQHVPYYRAPNPNIYVAPQAGLALFPGDSLLMKWRGMEDDPLDDDYLGSITRTFTQAENWGMGPVQELSSNDTLGFGGYDVKLEIVRAPLPDLIPTDIRVGNFADNGDDIVCLMVENGGTEPAGPYTLRFYVDGAIPRNGLISEAGVLEAGGHLERCFQTTIAAGQHQFAATVDEDQKVAEYNELNNRKALTASIQRRNPGVTGPLGPAGGGVLDQGTAKPEANALADLVPSSLAVKGKEPTGSSDCDPGKNDVTVQIKNVGTADASGFNVILLVDGDQDDGGTKAVEFLGKGQHMDVIFDDVKLKKGLHQLQVRVDPEGKIAESNNGNNQLSAGVSCKDE